jgi:hypothetical protein
MQVAVVVAHILDLLELVQVDKAAVELVQIITFLDHLLLQQVLLILAVVVGVVHQVMEKLEVLGL